MSGVERLVWRDGAFVPWREATVHVLAQSLQRGSLAFDYMGIRQARRGVAIFRLGDHIDRLFNTCALMGLPIAWTREALLDGCAATVRANLGATSLKISALLPAIEAELVPRDPHVAVFICAYDNDADILGRSAQGEARRSRINLKVERDVVNRRPDIIPPQAKMAGNYTSAMFAKWRARREGFDDIVLLDANASVAEAPTSNIFIVADGALATPPERNVLQGITRASIIELAHALGIPCAERDLPVADLMAADEVFLSATSVGVRPVVRIDHQAVGDGEPGPVSMRLREALDAAALGEAPAFEHWLHYV